MTKTWRRHLPKWHKPYYYVWFIHIIHSSTGLFHLCYLFIYQVCFNHVIQSSTRSASSMLSLHLRGLLHLCYPLIYQVCIFHVIHSSIPGLFHLCYPSIYQVCFICVIHSSTRSASSMLSIHLYQVFFICVIHPSTRSVSSVLSIHWNSGDQLQILQFLKTGVFENLKSSEKWDPSCTTRFRCFKCLTKDCWIS